MAIAHIMTAHKQTSSGVAAWARRTKQALLAALAASALGGCTIYDDGLYGGGYAANSWGYDCYSRYGDRLYDYYDSWDYYGGDYGRGCYEDEDYRRGFIDIGYYGGWYNNLFYPGYGLYVYDRFGRAYPFTRDLLGYWGWRRSWYRHNYIGYGWNDWNRWRDRPRKHRRPDYRPGTPPPPPDRYGRGEFGDRIINQPGLGDRDWRRGGRDGGRDGRRGRGAGIDGGLAPAPVLPGSPAGTPVAPPPGSDGAGTLPPAREDWRRDRRERRPNADFGSEIGQQRQPRMVRPPMPELSDDNPAMQPPAPVYRQRPARDPQLGQPPMGQPQVRQPPMRDPAVRAPRYTPPPSAPPPSGVTPRSAPPQRSVPQRSAPPPRQAPPPREAPSRVED